MLPKEKASLETVRRTLHTEGLVETPRRKPAGNPSRPRFFERARPNQMWQNFTFRLGGWNAYLLGHIDDYSRYIFGKQSPWQRGHTWANHRQEILRPLCRYDPEHAQSVAWLLEVWPFISSRPRSSSYRTMINVPADHEEVLPSTLVMAGVSAPVPAR